jgi:hypothetical protein
VKRQFTDKELLEALREMVKEGKLVEIVKNGQTYWQDVKTFRLDVNPPPAGGDER